MQQDYTYLPKPNKASYYLDAAMNTASFAMGMQGGGSGGSGQATAPKQYYPIKNPNISGTNYLL
jgi:hypothetical protein